MANDRLMSTAARELRALILAETDETSVQIGPWRPTNPAHAVSLTVYPMLDDAQSGDVEFSAQVRIRGTMEDSPTDMLDRQDDIWSVLCRADPVVDTEHLTIIVARRRMSAPLGLDAQGRPEIADTYDLRTDRMES